MSDRRPYFRLIRPIWGKKELRKEKRGKVTIEPNPDFVREILGPDTLEGYFDEAFVTEKNAAGYNIYYFPNHPSEVRPGTKFISGRDIDVFQWVFVDMDLKDKIYASTEEFLQVIDAFPVPPSKTVMSGHGMHVYWQIRDLDRESFMILQFMLIQFFQTDESVWTPLQLLRWPASVNTKDPHAPVQVQTLPNYSTGKSYEVKDLFGVLPEITTENLHKCNLHLAKLQGLHSLDFGKPEALVNELPPIFEDLMKQEPYIKDLFERPEETYGDRSAADMALCNHLFTHKLTRKDATQVMFNVEKARSRSGASRASYAASVIDKVYGDRSVHTAYSIEELSEMGTLSELSPPVNGPSFFDCLEDKWLRRQILGLIAPPGSGKTSITLKIIREFIRNNPHNDDVFLFFSLEMSVGQIRKRWDRLTKDDPAARNRLFVQSNEAPSGKRLHINLQQMVFITKDTEARTGKKVGAVVIDHLAMVERSIDTKMEPNFGFHPGYSTHRNRSQITIEVPELCKCLKELADMLDTFVIVQSQTTKEKAGDGDKPLEMNAAFGASAFEWICDYVITCWQPLLKMYDRSPLRVTGWRYAKIREIGEKDAVQRGQQNLLHYNVATGDLRALTPEEYKEAGSLLQQLKDLKKEAAKNGTAIEMEYSNSPDFKRMKLVLDSHQNRGSSGSGSSSGSSEPVGNVQSN